MKHKILIIGAGGIGSFLCREAHRLVMQGQIDLAEVDITLCDNDTVELKNIKYQDFASADVLKPKAEVLASRYGFRALTERVVNGRQLDLYDVIVLCVDNASTRQLVYLHCSEHEKYFIDARAEGRGVAVFTWTKKDFLPRFLETLKGEGGNRSCQLQHDLSRGVIQNGNVIAAAIASQYLLNYLRGEENPPEFRAMF